jgi:hypothetical protein
MKPYYQFISTPYECDLGSSVNNHIEFSITDRDVPLHDMLEQFKYFLQATGYCIKPNEHIEIVTDEEEFEQPSEHKWKDVTRVEVIDDNGRAYVGYGLDSVSHCVQDDGQTLKIFVENEKLAYNPNSFKYNPE